MFDSSKIEKNIKRIGRSVISTVKKTFIGIFTFLTITLSGLAAMFFFMNFPLSTAIGIFFGFLALAFLIADVSILVSLSGSSEDDYNYRKEIISCEKTLVNLKRFINSQPNKDEYINIYNSLNQSLENAKLSSKKIDNIRTTLKNKDWNIDYIEKQISNEFLKSNKDKNLIDKLNEQKENINKLKEREEQLITKLALLKTNFNSIYTKITLLSTSDGEKNSFDEIETEIQKNLDFKLKVSQYEEELGRKVEL